MTIMCLSILWTTLVVAGVQAYSSEQSSAEENAKPVIENKNVNKNVNIIVNVDPQEVAQELWKIIDARLNNNTNHITSSQSIMKDLEDAITPLVSPSRRGIPPSAFQVADQLDKITRRALTRDAPSMNMLDEEIMTRDIVADMMASLKIILSKDTQVKTDKKDTSGRRMMQRPVTTTMSYDDELNDYANIRIKIRRKDILDAIY
ncbi:uncharacterized protein LOC112455276 [Temnothorax curvispinosus]|uniref:Uncharacterized protein LOC112455276 n=1 Tax=Temnothorax curvispinosus TaxID=300111 RepID=A0A6J1PSS1_9HYME|nr:uncharacterized protein LOC112455276 [Temnothorax curvispinosus]